MYYNVGSRRSLPHRLSVFFPRELGLPTNNRPRLRGFLLLRGLPEVFREVFRWGVPGGGDDLDMNGFN